MAKRKINYNAAIDDVKKALHELCIDFYFTSGQTQMILEKVESKRRPQASTQGVPDPPPTPPGHGTGGGN
jgi:hypothetical protein